MGESWDTFDKSMFGIKGLEGEKDLKITKGFDVLPRYSNADLIGFQNFICEVFKEIYRVIKPGGHCLVWSIPRTSHHTGMGLERAGFEVRDCIYHAFSQGFPKNLNISKQIDKIKGVDRKVIGKGYGKTLKKINNTNKDKGYRDNDYYEDNDGTFNITEPSSEEAKQWDGWGTSLKPGIEVWWLIRKPISEKNITENVLKWGTGSINIDGCRIPRDEEEKHTQRQERSANWNIDNCRFDSTKNTLASVNKKGGYPINFIHDGSEEVLEHFPVINTETTSRFFYNAKPSGKDKNEGLDGEKNTHPTIKSTNLMRYLCRLITPPNGTVLDPFMGSGSTGKGALLEGFNFIGIEKEQEYFDIAEKRIKHIYSTSVKKEDIEEVKNENIKRLF